MATEQEAERIRIPYVYKYGSEHNYNYMIMTLLGPNLEQLRQKHKGFSVPTILKLGIQMLETIEHLHNQHYIHRDIKPENFCLDLD